VNSLLRVAPKPDSAFRSGSTQEVSFSTSYADNTLYIERGKKRTEKRLDSRKVS